jgi:flagellar biosynthesis protein
MNTALPPPQRRVTLRLAGPEAKATPLPPEALELLLARARALGLPLHHDPQIASILAALRLRDDVPVLLYAAAAAVLASVYDASGEPAP